MNEGGGNSMLKEIKIWVELTIPGFLYILSGFFSYLLVFNINDLESPKSLKDYSPFLSIFIIILSSIVGYSAYKLLERLVYLVRPKYNYNAKAEIKYMQKVPLELRTRYNDFYLILVFFRHLIIGTFLTGSTLILWLRCSNNLQYQNNVILIFIIFITLFIITYNFQKKTFKDFKEELEKEFEL